MAKNVVLKASGLEALRSVNPRLVSYNVEMTEVTGGTAPITGNKYTLNNSAVASSVKFASLAPGKYTLYVGVNLTSYYAKSGQTIGTINSHQTLMNHHFVVLDKVVDTSTCTHKYTTTIAKEASCSNTGVSVTSCSVCGLTTKKDLAKTHVFGAYTVTKAATCTEDGSIEKTCSLCSEVVKEVIDALGHTWNHAGCTTKTCTVCGATEGSASGHSYTDATNLSLVNIISTKEEIILTILLHSCRGPQSSSQPLYLRVVDDTLMLGPLNQILRRETIKE